MAYACSANNTCMYTLYTVRIISPRRIREGYGIVVLCVSITKLAALYVENKVPLGFLWHFQDMYCVDFE